MKSVIQNTKPVFRVLKWVEIQDELRRDVSNEGEALDGVTDEEREAFEPAEHRQSENEGRPWKAEAEGKSTFEIL